MYKENIIQFQPKKYTTKTIIIVHPHPTTLNQLVQTFEKDGYLVFGFKKVQEANRKIIEFDNCGIYISGIVVPKKLWVSTQLTYKQFLNHMLPKYRVYTVDNRDYRDTINLKTWENK